MEKNFFSFLKIQLNCIVLQFFFSPFLRNAFSCIFNRCPSVKILVKAEVNLPWNIPLKEKWRALFMLNKFFFFSRPRRGIWICICRVFFFFFFSTIERWVVQNMLDVGAWNERKSFMYTRIYERNKEKKTITDNLSCLRVLSSKQAKKVYYLLPSLDQVRFFYRAPSSAVVERRKKKIEINSTLWTLFGHARTSQCHGERATLKKLKAFSSSPFDERDKK